MCDHTYLLHHVAHTHGMKMLFRYESQLEPQSLPPMEQGGYQVFEKPRSLIIVTRGGLFFLLGKPDIRKQHWTWAKVT